MFSCTIVYLKILCSFFNCESLFLYGLNQLLPFLDLDWYVAALSSAEVFLSYFERVFVIGGGGGLSEDHVI
jgi:hypothetical protein